MYGFKPVGLFIILSHLLPLYLTKSSPLDINPNLIVFALYNLVLFSIETDIWEVYQKVFTPPPPSIKDYFIQRGLWSMSSSEYKRLLYPAWFMEHVPQRELESEVRAPTKVHTLMRKESFIKVF